MRVNHISNSSIDCNFCNQKCFCNYYYNKHCSCCFFGSAGATGITGATGAAGNTGTTGATGTIGNTG